MPKRRPGQPRGDQRWSTFLKNHAKAILACDFFVAVTATFRMLYVFVVIEHGTRRLAHINVTANPTADWTLLQLREVVVNGGGHRYLIHDRDQIFAKQLDDSIRALGIHVLRSPVVSPRQTPSKDVLTARLDRVCQIPRRNLKLSEVRKSPSRGGGCAPPREVLQSYIRHRGLKDECLNRMILLVGHRRAAPLVIALSIITKSISQIA